FNGVGDSTVLTDAFYVLKDTTAPTFVNNQTGDGTLRTAGGTTYDVRAFDSDSKLAAFQYSASTTPGTADAGALTWTDVAANVSGNGSYATPWPVAFASLPSDVTSYISVRAWDLAGTTSTAVDVFYVLKDTAGPQIRITQPS